MDQLNPIHRPRHFHVREHKADIWPSLKHLDRFNGVGSLKSLETGRNHDLQNGHANQRMVLDHQNDALAN